MSFFSTAKTAVMSAFGYGQGGSRSGYATEHKPNSVLTNSHTWQPAIASANQHVLPVKEALEARAGELVRSNGYNAGALDYHCTTIVGPKGLSLKYTPIAEQLGLTPAEAREFAKTVESEWKATVEDDRNLLDASGQHNWVALQHLVCKQWLIQGEILAIPKMLKRGPDACETAIMPIDSKRLAPPTRNQVDKSLVKGGVEIDPSTGAPVAYWIFPHNPLERHLLRPGQTNEPERVTARGRFGRKKVIHVFDAHEPGQNRAASLMSPAFETSKRLSNLSDQYLKSAITAASFAVIIKSSMNYGEAMKVLGADGPTGAQMNANPYNQWTEQKEAYYSNLPVFFNGTKALHLMPDEELQIVNNEGMISGEFGDVSKVYLKEIAAGSGSIPTFGIDSDYSQINYSASQTALSLSIDGHQAGRRNRVMVDFCRAVFALWLEELFIRKTEILPEGVSFYSHRAALVNSTWTGGHRVVGDPVKQVAAAEKRMENRLTSRREECERLGVDFDEMVEQMRVEAEILADLPDPKVNRSAVVIDPDADQEG